MSIVVSIAEVTWHRDPSARVTEELSGCRTAVIVLANESLIKHLVAPVSTVAAIFCPPMCTRATSRELLMLKDVEGSGCEDPYPLVRYGPDSRFPAAGGSTGLF